MQKPIVVIKIGGSTMDAPSFFEDFGAAVAKIASSTTSVIVHGGGKDIGRQLDLLNKKFTFVDGMRVTDAQTVGVVQMVLSGDVNKRLINSLQISGVRSVGLSGVDGFMLTAVKLMVKGQDIGFVGEITSVDTTLLTLCASAGMVSVVSPISRDSSGQIYNVNADPAAAEIAMALKADDLLYVSDVPGVKISGSVAREIKTDQIEGLIADGHVTGGMIPKLRSAAQAVARGVLRVHICGWRGSCTLAEELDPSNSTGTIIY